MAKLFDELKRRNVIRVAAAYIVGAWVLLQVADLVMDNLGAPDWVMKVLLLICTLAFPLVLAFSWAFELTPDGIKREAEVERSTSITHETAKKLDRITIALLLLVIVLVAVDRFLPATTTTREASDTIAAVTPDSAVSEKSIAVLAFEDLSAEGDQGYFADGISEELLNTLAKIPDLKVAGRTSSFAFRDQNRDLREIGEILEVAHVLEGSVRKSGNRIRVTAQLVKTADGFHVFSENYDRELTDIFVVQDDIAQQIAAALRSVIMGDEAVDGLATATPTDPAVYNNYLRARQWIHTRNKDLMAKASELLDRAIEIDPGYAPAYAQQATATLLLSDYVGSYGDIPANEALARSRPLIDKALALDANLAEAHAALGLWYSMNDITGDKAIEALREALRINPNLSDAQVWLANELDVLGRQKESMKLAESLIERDPLNLPVFVNLTFLYLHSGQLHKAEALTQRIARITGDTPGVLMARGAREFSLGNLASAVEMLGAATAAAPSAGLLRAWYGLALLKIGDYDTVSQSGLPTHQLLALELSGRHQEAVAVFDAFPDQKLQDLAIHTIASWFQLQKRPQDLIDYLEDHYEAEGGMMQGLPRSRQLIGNPHLTEIAYALQQVGRAEDAEALLAEIGQLRDDIAKNDADNALYWLFSAEYAAITGNQAALYDSMRHAIDRGWLSAAGFYEVPFDPYRDTKEFIALENESIRRAQEERKKLDNKRNSKQTADET